MNIRKYCLGKREQALKREESCSRQISELTFKLVLEKNATFSEELKRTIEKLQEMRGYWRGEAEICRQIMLYLEQEDSNVEQVE